MRRSSFRRAAARAAYANDIMLAKMIEALDRDLSGHSGLHASGPWQHEATCLTAIQYGFSSVMMDGSLEGRRQDAGLL